MYAFGSPLVICLFFPFNLCIFLPAERVWDAHQAERSQRVFEEAVMQKMEVAIVAASLASARLSHWKGGVL